MLAGIRTQIQVLNHLSLNPRYSFFVNHVIGAPLILRDLDYPRRMSAPNVLAT